MAVPISDKRAITILDALVRHEVLQGLLPSRLVFRNECWKPYKGRIVSDNGREFKNELFQAFLNMFNVRFGYTIPYHPQSNPVERVHRFINSLVRASVQSSTGPCECWAEALPYRRRDQRPAGRGRGPSLRSRRCRRVRGRPSSRRWRVRRLVVARVFARHLVPAPTIIDVANARRA